MTSTRSFQVIATGSPTPTLTETGALPSGLTFTVPPGISGQSTTGVVPNGTVSGILSGTPAPGSAGVYHITFVATNGIPPDATQSFVLTVNPSADIPMLQTWAVVLLILLLGGMTANVLRRH
ncbi:MAG TPA: putative Ig domain-containing protein [Casimicrobiaceae bacterium]|nr:putative Ig domain-containing protein [Casimicrobiaceae bacterium]